MKKIVILGAGFGGIACAKSLLKQKTKAEITIIDKSPEHIIHGNLYEVATSPEELTRLGELKLSVAVPLVEIFRNEPVQVKIASVKEVDLVRKIVTTSQGDVAYDFLVSSMGAGPNFFAIPGASDYSMTMLSATDALRIRTQVENIIQTHKLDVKKPVVNILIAGGGVAGVELAAEMQKMLDFVSWQNNYSRDKINTVIVERSPCVLNGFPRPVIDAATQRLLQLGIGLQTGTTVQKVESHQVITDKGQFEFDILLWTGGVSANGLPGPVQTPVAAGKRIEVNDNFQLSEFLSVYVIGDQCCHHDPLGNPLPGTASQAIDHARFVARSIAAALKNRKIEKHSCKLYPFIIPLGGEWAIYSSSRLFLKGYLGYLIREMVWLKYFTEILGTVRGFHWWFRSNELHQRND